VSRGKRKPGCSFENKDLNAELASSSLFLKFLLNYELVKLLNSNFFGK
jgi:hypothetical protein